MGEGAGGIVTVSTYLVVVDAKLVITIIIIILIYFTTLEHLKAGIKGEELLYPDTLSYGCVYVLKEH